MSKIVLVGADPELFWQNERGFMSVIGKIGGTKDKNLPIDSEGNGVLEDNVAAEFNIPPCDNVDDFVRHINKNLDYLTEKARGFNATLSTAASASFPEEEMADPRAWVFGCEPDFNAWTDSINPKPTSEDMLLRSCGGHVHIGHGKGVAVNNVIRAMDLYLGVPSTKLDTDSRRRELYGKAGAHRRKPYGSEYRTLSNFWIFSDELKAWVFERTQRAVEFARNNTIADDLKDIVELAINKGNAKARDQVFEMFPEVRI